MTFLNNAQDLIDELDKLRTYGVTVPAAAYEHAHQVDMRLLSLLGRRDAALLVLRRAGARPGTSDRSLHGDR